MWGNRLRLEDLLQLQEADLAKMLSMTDLFSYLLPYPAVSLSCDSKLQSLTNLPSKLTVTALLVDSGKSSLVIKQREYQFNPTFS